MKLGYVCTNFNNSHHTEKAVESLLASAGTHHDVRIVVVDNNSAATELAPLERLANDVERVHLLRNEQNVGYFRGLNTGIHWIRSQYPEYRHLVIGNNDLVFPEHFCDEVEAISPKLSVHPVISPDIVTLDGEHQNPHVIRTISRARELVYDLYYANYHLAQLILWLARRTRTVSDRADEQHYRTAQEIYQGHGSCYLIGPKFFEHFEDLWAPTFLMGEEYFLSKQLSDQGMKTFYDPAVRVTHHCHGSLTQVPSRRAWEFARDAHRVYRRYVKVFG